MQPQPEAYIIAIGIPGTNPPGPAITACQRCRARKPIAMSTAVAIFDLREQSHTLKILCWGCLLKDPEAMAKVNGAKIPDGKALRALNPLGTATNDQ